METLEPKDQKQAELERIDLEIETITDGLGMEIDPGIRETVKFLRANGFETDQSCEGHIDRALPYPWVDIGTIPGKDSRFQELQEKIDFEKEMHTMTPAEEKEYMALRTRVTFSNRSKNEMLRGFLKIFYEKFPHDTETMLTIDPRGLGRGRLQPKSVPKDTPDEIREKISAAKLGLKLQAYQSEMQRFTEFLKEDFFNPSIHDEVRKKRYEAAFKGYSRYFSLTNEDIQKSILDVGAFRGDFIQYLRKVADNKKAYGVEYEFNKIDPEAEGMVSADGLLLPFSDETFELVLARDYIPMFLADAKERGKSLSELIRVTKSGGEIRCDISTPEKEMDKLLKEEEEKARQWLLKRYVGAQVFMGELDRLEAEGLTVEIKNEEDRTILVIHKP